MKLAMFVKTILWIIYENVLKSITDIKIIGTVLVKNL